VLPQAADGLVEKLGRLPAGLPADWRPAFASGTESRLNLAVPKDSGAGTVWLAAADIAVPQPVAVEFLASSGSTMRVWLNGQPIHQRKLAGPFRLDSERFEGALDRGVNRVVVEVGTSGTAVDFHLRFRRKSATAEHERLTRLALTQAGNPARGRTLFFNVEKSLCLKCHRLGDQGERIGPELSGVGSRFSRIYLVESILEPSRTIAPSYGSYTALLSSGKVLTGVKVAETDTLLTLADNQGHKHELRKSDIEELQPQPASTMPDGLEKRLSEQEFIDLIAFLASQKEAAPR
jgi:putative heme-binding domain-containing protein